MPRVHCEAWKGVNGGPYQRWADPSFDFGAHARRAKAIAKARQHGARRNLALPGVGITRHRERGLFMPAATFGSTHGEYMFNDDPT